MRWPTGKLPVRGRVNVRYPLIIASIFGVLAGAAACGGGEPEASSPPPSASPLPPAATTTASPLPPEETTTAAISETPGLPSGKILLLSCPFDDPGAWHLDVIDPTPGSSPEQLARFQAEGYQTAFTESRAGRKSQCEGRPDFLLQLFNHDFTKMAVHWLNYEDDSVHAGYLERDGAFVDLTTVSTGYTSAPRELDGVFKPGTSELYIRIQSGEGFDTTWEGAKIDTDAGGERTIIPDTSEPKDRPYETYEHDVIIFSRDGSRTMSAISNYAFNPSGTLAAAGTFEGHVLDLRDPAGIGRDLNGDPPQLQEPCSPTTWVTDDRLLCTTDSQIYTVDVRGTDANVALDQHAVLPEGVDRQNFGAIPSADGRSVAFMSVQGATATLFVAPLDGSEEPVAITDLSRHTRLLRWHP